MVSAVVDVAGPILEWVQRRSGKDSATFRAKFRDWDRWLAQEAHPTLGQVQDLAQFTHVPFGLLLLREPPAVKLPIPDFRVTSRGASEPSQDLLDVIYLNQQRQSWFEEYLTRMGAEPLGFVGSARSMPVGEAAAVVTDALDFGVARRRSLRGTREARKHLIRAFEALGGLAVVSSMVGNNTNRMLDREEFRGFTLRSHLAPLVFVNAHDTLAGQVFSLLHEFAHVWHGDTGLSNDGDPLLADGQGIEQWCDQVAAEVAVPRSDLRRRFEATSNLTDQLDQLAEVDRCSTLVILIRLRDEGLIPREGFADEYERELDRVPVFVAAAKSDGGGDFYNNQPLRIGERSSHAILSDVRRGATPITEALRLMSFKSTSVFDSYAERLERD